MRALDFYSVAQRPKRWGSPMFYRSNPDLLPNPTELVGKKKLIVPVSLVRKAPGVAGFFPSQHGNLRLSWFLRHLIFPARIQRLTSMQRTELLPEPMMPGHRC